MKLPLTVLLPAWLTMEALVALEVLLVRYVKVAGRVMSPALPSRWSCGLPLVPLLSVIVFVPAPKAAPLVIQSWPALMSTPPLKVLSAAVSTHLPAPVLVRDVLPVEAFWSVRRIAKVLAPVLVPVRVRVRAPAVSNRLMFAPVLVKLTVAPGTLPEASIMPPAVLMRIWRSVLCGVAPVYCSVPPRKAMPMPSPLAVSCARVRAPRAPATP